MENPGKSTSAVSEISKNNKLDVVIIGGGMITNDLILPSIYHLQRIGIIGNITISALNTAPLKALANNSELRQSFPGQSFRPSPEFSLPDTQMFPNLYKEMLSALPPYQCVIVAVPDQMHYEIVKEALKTNHHILCVKPLVLQYNQTKEIEKIAYEKGLFIGVEYHKRFDRRALLAKKQYQEGHLGQFILGEAKLFEPYYYRHSNFQNWFTCDKTDPFTYVGCHYVDLVYYITGLKPKELSVKGIKGKFPNGKEGFLWSCGRVTYENGAILSVTNGLGYPDEAAGSNEQCLTMFFEGPNKTGYIRHNDQFRGVEHSYIDSVNGGKPFNYINPDFFRLVPWEGLGYKPVGYGYESIAASLTTMYQINNDTRKLDTNASLAVRKMKIKEIDQRGIIATPSNSFFNELVTEAARLSIQNDGEIVDIIYGEQPHVKLRHSS